MGYITRGRGVSVHRKDCPNISELASELDGQERFIDVGWDTSEKAEYPVEIQIIATDRPGLLTNITQKINDSNLSLLSLNARTNKEKTSHYQYDFGNKRYYQLKELIRGIKKI